MSLVPMSELLVRARRSGYAVGAFEVWNLESIQAVIGAAEGLAQPVILQVGPGEADYAGMEDIAHAAIFHARRAKVPVVLHLDHGDTFERVMQCLNHGFTSVMLDVSHLPYAENVAATKEVARVAHACGVSVEGEMDRIGGGATGIDVPDDAHLTNPDQAVEFVRATGIDAFAVAIGTVHGFYQGEPHIRLGLLEKIAARVPIPLVLHGGSGTPEADVRKAVSLGIAKVNICTEFVAAFADTYAHEHAASDFRYNVPGVFLKPRAAARQLAEKKIRLFAGL
ncbi:MAG: class II fructose-bisphosphate aldolase [Planctomycetes bacterium]|nr:class II fructose-bisphosphate aldolase [Planctomycetota bacterium]